MGWSWAGLGQKEGGQGPDLLPCLTSSLPVQPEDRDGAGPAGPEQGEAEVRPHGDDVRGAACGREPNQPPAFCVCLSQVALRQPPGSGPTEEAKSGLLWRGCPSLQPHMLPSDPSPEPTFYPQAPLTDLLSEQKAKVVRLQAELETSEQVQRDFVRLSQALQVWQVPSHQAARIPGDLSWGVQGQSPS